MLDVQREAVRAARAKPKQEVTNTDLSALKPGGDLERRMLLAHSGALDLYMEILLDEGQNYAKYLSVLVWEHLCAFVDNDNADYYDEHSREFIAPCPTSRLKDLGLFPLASKQLDGAAAAASGNPVLTNTVLRTLRFCATNPDCALPLILARAHVGAIHLVKTVAQWDATFDRSLIYLHRLSFWENARRPLREEGALDAVVPHLDKLASETGNADELLRGYLAASIVCRLAGSDEVGPFAELIRNTPLLIAHTLSALDSVLKNRGFVHGLILNPMQMTFDLAALARSDANRVLLRHGAIPVLITALERCGEKNLVLTKDVLEIFLLLSFDEVCLQELVELGATFMPLFKKHLDGSGVDTEFKRALLNLEQQMGANNNLKQDEEEDMAVPLPSPQPTRLSTANFPPPPSSALPAKKGGFYRLLNQMPRKLSATAAPAAPTAPVAAAAAPSPPKHVMLSYQWDVQALVMECDAQLKRRGIKTWFDIHDMKGNINDSMAHAVENAACVLVFLTQKYKHSGNCRKECEYADSSRVPIIYIMAEPGFVPQGWLGLIMGKALYFPAADKKQLAKQMDGIIARLRDVTNLLPTAATTTTTTTTTPIEKTDEMEELREMFEAFKQASEAKLMQVQRDLEAKVDALEQQIRALQPQ